MKLSPGFCVISTTIRSESTFVHARDAVDDVAVARDHLACLDDHHVAQLQLGRRNRLGRALVIALIEQPTCDRVRLCPAQRIGLRLTATLGYRLGEVREEHGQPQPHDDQPGEDARVGDRDHRREHRADLDDEHDRVLVEREWVQFA
jgi:hypothetical protein